MTKQRRKALWGLMCISVLFALLIGGLSSYVKTAGLKGNVSAAASAASQAGAMHPWTAVASTGTVDESAFAGGAPIFAFNPVAMMANGAISSVSYHPASPSLAPIIVRYNVTNTFDNNIDPLTGAPTPNMPGWNILELGSTAPPVTAVTATAFRVRPCNGVQEVLCTVTNSGQPNPTNCVRCQFPATLGPVDFGDYLYYVEVVLRRGTAGVTPQAHTLRIY
jgi:hypothetical protein